MNAAHIHLALNHIPVVGTVIGLFLLATAVLRRRDEPTRASAAIFIGAALFLAPVHLSGEQAEEGVEDLPGVLEAAIERRARSRRFGPLRRSSLSAPRRRTLPPDS
jgi:hypothetical protein